VQLATIRGATTGHGEINFALFGWLDAIGTGLVGCEYRPATSTEAGSAARPRTACREFTQREDEMTNVGFIGSIMAGR